MIVSYRCAGLLRECLASLRLAEPPADGGLSVHVVDNASRDGTAEMVRSEFGDVDLVVNASNAGFAAASNAGIRRGRAPFVCVLNPDTRLEPETLRTLVAALEAEPRAAAAGPLLTTPDGGLDHAAKRSFPTVRGALAYFTRLDRVLPGERQYTAPAVDGGPVEAINGAFMLIRRSALDQVGLFDEGYWMYMEDLDLCYRFQQAGFLVLFEPRARASHLKGGSAGEHRPARLNAAFHYGMYRFYRKFYAPGRPALANLIVYCGIAAKLAVSVPLNAIRRAASTREGAATRSLGSGHVT